MQVGANLKRLIDRLAPFWAGEAEVFETYWTWTHRTRETDRRWLALQCTKELWGSGLAASDEGLLVGAARELIAAFPRVERGRGRRELLALADGLRSEFAHYCAFADAHDALALPGEPLLDPHALRDSWEEDRALARLRAEHRARDAKLGERAARLTEGGYCTLFSSGMALGEAASGAHARANALIASTCRGVYEDEFQHMLAGIAGIEEEGLAAADWVLLEQMAVAQSSCRIEMRNAQFSRPLAPDRLARALAGACDPLSFDWKRAHSLRLSACGCP